MNKTVKMVAKKSAKKPASSLSTTWTFMSNHAAVLVLINRHNCQPVRDIATQVGITPRAVQKIIAELKAGGYINITREGLNNRYTINGAQRLRHTISAHRTVRELLDFVG